MSSIPTEQAGYCGRCGKEIEVISYQDKRRKYCSDACRQGGHRRRVKQALQTQLAVCERMPLKSLQSCYDLQEALIDTSCAVRRHLSLLWMMTYEELPISRQTKNKALADIGQCRRILSEIEAIFKQEETTEAA